VLLRVADAIALQRAMRDLAAPNRAAGTLIRRAS
jgi:hypothetical protein